jgi:hypothetical protein
LRPQYHVPLQEAKVGDYFDPTVDNIDVDVGDIDAEPIQYDWSSIGGN